MKMSVSKALALRMALQNCDGHQVLVSEGEEKKPTFVLYELGFEARFAIAKNQNALNEVYDTYVKARNDTIKALAKNGTGINPQEEPEAFSALRAKEVEMLDAEVSVNLEKLKKEHIAKSNLPSSVLAAIMDIIEE